MQARTSRSARPTPTPAEQPGKLPMPATPAAAEGKDKRPEAPSSPESREEMRQKRLAEYAVRQTFVLERMRLMGRAAVEAAKARKAPDRPPAVFYVNNESGDDQAPGLSADNAVRTLARAVSLLKPGDKLHLAVTGQPYRETLRFGDDFGGIPGKPVIIEGHGATLTGSDPLRLGGWEQAGTPGLYKSARFITELEEFDEASKLMRVYFIFDGVVQHMGRSSKGAKPHFKAPAALQPGEWTYVEAEKSFYLKVSGTLAEAKIEAPYRRNGLTVRAPKVAMTHVVIKDLIVCHVLNDGYNLHGMTQEVLLQNIAAYECGDDGISPHETCEVTLDGFWSVGNSTGMGNGNLSVTKASNVHLEGNLAHQFMTGHAPVTELRNAVIIATPGTQPVNVTNAQATRLKMDNVRIFSPANQSMLNVVNSQVEGRRLTVVGPGWENAGSIHITESVIAGSRVTTLPGGAWASEKNNYAIAFGPEAKNMNCENKVFGPEVLKAPGQPFPGAGADASEFKIPPRPVPHPAAGKFTCLIPAKQPSPP